MGIFLEMYKRELEENNEEITLIEGKVYSYLGGPTNMCILIEPDDRRNYGGGIAYFKIYDAKNKNSAKRMNRISLTVPKYIKHNFEGKEEWILDQKERKLLNEILYKIKDDGVLIYDKLFYEYKKYGINISKPKEFPNYENLNGYI